MSQTDSTWMSRVSQRKLTGSAALTLHRWVLIKNLVTTTDDVQPPSSSVSSSSPSSSSSASSSSPPPSSVASPPYVYSSSQAEEEVFVFPDADIFVFPDVTSLVSADAASVSAEAAWLDSLMDEFEDDDYSEEEPMSSSATSVIGDTESRFVASSAFDCSTHAIASCSLAVSQPIPIPNLSATASLSSSLSDSLCTCTPPSPTPSSLPSTPRLLDDLPFFSPDGVDDSSDDESEGPETPLYLSTLGHAPALGAAALHEPAVVFSEPDSYFVYPTEPAPIVPRSQSFHLQEC